jgi:hypothetical protein
MSRRKQFRSTSVSEFIESSPGWNEMRLKMIYELAPDVFDSGKTLYILIGDGVQTPMLKTLKKIKNVQDPVVTIDPAYFKKVPTSTKPNYVTVIGKDALDVNYSRLLGKYKGIENVLVISVKAHVNAPDLFDKIRPAAVGLRLYALVYICCRKGLKSATESLTFNEKYIKESGKSQYIYPRGVKKSLNNGERPFAKKMTENPKSA